MPKSEGCGKTFRNERAKLGGYKIFCGSGTAKDNLCHKCSKKYLHFCVDCKKEFKSNEKNYEIARCPECKKLSENQQSQREINRPSQSPEQQKEPVHATENSLGTDTLKSKVFEIKEYCYRCEEDAGMTNKNLLNVKDVKDFIRRVEQRLCDKFAITYYDKNLIKKVIKEESGFGE